MNKKIIGIIGGMGPEATAALFSKIIKLTPAKNDQEHLKVIIYNNPQIPDRTAAILENGEDPVPVILETAQILANAGADYLVMPCNTAHYFYDRLQSEIEVPIINMIKETARKVYGQNSETEEIGLLATRGTVATKIYHQAFADYNIEVLTPTESGMEEVMDIIYRIKSGKGTEERKERLTAIATDLINSGAEGIILGCTELPLLFNFENFNYPVYIPDSILAGKAIEKVWSEDN